MHDILFSLPSQKLGKMHCIMLASQHSMEKLCYEQVEVAANSVDNPITFHRYRRTEFGNEVERDEVHWWIFKKESDLRELRTRTDETLQAAQTLKQDASKLKLRSPVSYDELLRLLSEFSESHTAEIDVLYEFVVWLNAKDSLAPSMLFSYHVWGTTRRHILGLNTIPQRAADEETLKAAVETVFGLLRSSIYTLESVRLDALGDEYYQTNSARPMWDEREILWHTSYQVILGLEEYFEFLRNSLRHVLEEIDAYFRQEERIRSATFWRRFINGILAHDLLESQLWDFKKTLEMWHCTGDAKRRAAFDFAKILASFANAQGGVLIIGVSDSPREIVGIGDDRVLNERHIKYTSDVISEYLDCSPETVLMHQVPFTISEGKRILCLVICVAQSASVVSAKDHVKHFVYPVRQEAGTAYSTPHEISDSKINVFSTNFKFVERLNMYL